MSLSPEELAAELSMTNREYLVVEGRSDKLFWEHLQREGLKKRYIRVANKKQCSGNKDYVKKVISIMGQRAKKNAVGIIDMDYDLVRNRIDKIDNLYYYKFLDMENVLIQSDSFSEVNSLISSTEKKMDDEILKSALYEKVYILGVLRWLNDEEEYHIDFSDLNYKKLMEYNSDKFLDYFMSKLHLNKAQREEFISKINLLIDERNDPWYICNGHDLLCVLRDMTKKTISNDNPIQYNEEIIEKMLILGYRKQEEAMDVQDCSDILLIE